MHGERPRAGSLTDHRAAENAVEPIQYHFVMSYDDNCGALIESNPGRHLGSPEKALAWMMHIELSRRHHQVMRLVVSALNHDTHKTERLELSERRRFGRQNRKLYAIW